MPADAFWEADMCQQLRACCDGCEYYCNPRPISLEHLNKLIQSNPRIANDIFELKTVMLVCPKEGATIYARLG